MKAAQMKFVVTAKKSFWDGTTSYSFEVQDLKEGEEITAEQAAVFTLMSIEADTTRMAEQLEDLWKKYS